MMMRLKNVQILPPRLDTMVENAYYQCIPPERQVKKRKDEPPLHQYIRKLLFADLNRKNTKYVLEQLRKIPYGSEAEQFLLTCFLKVHKGKFSNVPLVASILSGLCCFHEELGIKVVDGVLEEIRLNMEENNFNKQQRQVMNLKYLGELYNYCVAESGVIFDTLNTLITFGHNENQDESPLDPSTDCFRIRLVCTLLDTCGQYFNRGSQKKRLDKFLAYFQRYILSKSRIPMDVEFMISDCFEALRPNLIRYQTYEQACEAVTKLEQEESSAPQEVPTNQRAQVSTKASIAESESDSDDSEDSTERADQEDEDEPNNEDDEDDEEDDENEEDEDFEEEEDAAAFNRGAAARNRLEDEEFDRELRKLTQDSLEAHKLEVRGNRMEMSIPMNLFRATGPNAKGRLDEESTPTQAITDSMSFRVLMKKGNKQAIKNIQVPLESPLAINSKVNQNAEREEQKELKRIVLKYEEREEEKADDYPHTKHHHPQEGRPYSIKSAIYQNIDYKGRDQYKPRNAAGNPPSLPANVTIITPSKSQQPQQYYQPYRKSRGNPQLSQFMPTGPAQKNK
jgi:regulator of nonsense transcripts 2